MSGKLLLPEIIELIDMKDFKALKEIISEWHPADLAELISDLPESQQFIVFRFLPKNLTSTVFDFLEVESQKNILLSMGKKEVAAIINELSPDDRTSLFEELPHSVLKNMLLLLNKEERKIAKTLLGYPEESVGRLMSPEYISVDEQMSIEDVLDKIRKYGADSETLDMIYVIDEDGKLIDDLTIREVLLSSPKKKVSKLMDYKFAFLNATDDQEIAVESFKKYECYALPVTDNDGFLIGIVTIDDILYVAEEETTEDIHKIGGVAALDDSYMNTSLFDLIKKRASWLVILFVGEMLTASAMAFYEKEIAKAVVLALFVPLIISSGGNSGSQATSLIIRGLALKEFGFRDWWKIMKREIVSGFTLGLILGIVGFTRIFVWQSFSGIYGEYWLSIAFVVMFSLIGVVMWGTLSGSMLPLLLKRMNLDPATSSAPFVATLVDVTGLIIYFTFAHMLLNGKLL
ncbi:MAG TPA: magnesium transporter [Spirochaetota bacterium]|nr:magnesium transporter [Spirochaetota bacterium]HPS85878.1 magnesium transporter [Spirochaetota bacterium]